MSENIHIVCNACAGVNRLAKDKLGSVANCARCKKLLLNGEVKPLHQTDFDTYVVNNDLPVVVDFWAPWCGPCKMMAPTFEKVAKELATTARFVKVNTEGEQELAARFAIRSIPTLAIFKNGREVTRQAGAMDAVSLKRLVMSV